jgi:hypothetical protein
MTQQPRIVWLTGCVLSLVSVLLFFSSSMAFADDGSGVKSISQSGVITAGGFPYKITQPGSYQLASNLTVPTNSEAIVITADDVTLDLNGFTISGPGVDFVCAQCSSGVVSGNDNITVRNGSVIGMAFGVALGSGALIEGVHAKGNLTAITVVSGVVRHCSTVSNYYGIYVYAGTLVEANFVTLNNGGIGAFGGATVIGNVAYQNGAGLFGYAVVYGSNSFQGNSQDVENGLISAPNVSQKNNICTGGVLC